VLRCLWKLQKKKWKKVLQFDTRLTFLYIPIWCLWC
jgi:hypothetical protein